MCFYISSDKRWNYKKVAEKSIPVYKIFSIPYDNRRKYFTSPYQHFDYEKGAVYEEDSMRVHNYDKINVGFHSYDSLIAAKYNYGGSLYEIIVKCSIPKGAYYYYNPVHNEYVSDTIKIGKKALVLQNSFSLE